mgnify:CR=1 FL=1
MSDHYFNRLEAEQLLPWLSDLLRQARDQKQAADRIDDEISSVSSKILMAGGMTLPYRELADKKISKDKMYEKLRGFVNKIEETGCIIKNLEQGLVDFPSMIREEEVYLCWKLGEERILYWHGRSEGFSGRKPLDVSATDPSPPSSSRPN